VAEVLLTKAQLELVVQPAPEVGVLEVLQVVQQVGAAQAQAHLEPQIQAAAAAVVDMIALL
jgi:hypothetical protein